MYNKEEDDQLDPTTYWNLPFNQMIKRQQVGTSISNSVFGFGRKSRFYGFFSPKPTRLALKPNLGDMVKRESVGMLSRRRVDWSFRQRDEFGGCRLQGAGLRLSSSHPRRHCLSYYERETSKLEWNTYSMD